MQQLAPPFGWHSRCVPATDLSLPSLGQVSTYTQGSAKTESGAKARSLVKVVLLQVSILASLIMGPCTWGSGAIV